MKTLHHHNYPVNQVPTFPLQDILRLFCLNSADRDSVWRECSMWSWGWK